MHRRDFIQSGAYLLGGLTLGNKWKGTASAPLKVAIIGCGDRGMGIMSVMKELPEMFTITSICDILDFRLAQASAYIQNKDKLSLTLNCIKCASTLASIIFKA